MSATTNTVSKTPPETSSRAVQGTRSLRFTQHRNFQKTLNERVNAYLRENNLPGRDVPAMYLKTAFALAWWLGTYLLLLLGHFSPLVNPGLCLVWAVAMASVGFNVDA